jgi:hypothetical protein
VCSSVSGRYLRTCPNTKSLKKAIASPNQGIERRKKEKKCLGH